MASRIGQSRGGLDSKTPLPSKDAPSLALFSLFWLFVSRHPLKQALDLDQPESHSPTWPPLHE